MIIITDLYYFFHIIIIVIICATIIVIVVFKFCKNIKESRFCNKKYKLMILILLMYQGEIVKSRKIV